MKDFMDTMSNLGFAVFTMDEGDKEPQPYKTKPAVCSKCDKDLQMQVPADAEGIVCFACDNAPPSTR